MCVTLLRSVLYWLQFEKTVCEWSALRLNFICFLLHLLSSWLILYSRVIDLILFALSFCIRLPDDLLTCQSDTIPVEFSVDASETQSPSFRQPFSFLSLRRLIADNSGGLKH